MNERRPIPGISPEKLLVSADGSVWAYHARWKRWHRLSLRKVRSNLVVNIVEPDGRSHTHTLASLVCRAFHGPRPIGHEPYHYPNHDSLDCRAENLRWAPRGTSLVGRKASNPIPKGVRLNAKFTPSQVVKMRALRREGWTFDDIAMQFQVSHGAVVAAVRGKTWSEIPGAVVDDAPLRQRGAVHIHAKLDHDDVRAIRRLGREGVPQRTIAAQFGVSRSAIQHVLYRKSYCEVDDE